MVLNPTKQPANHHRSNGFLFFHTGFRVANAVSRIDYKKQYLLIIIRFLLNVFTKETTSKYAGGKGKTKENLCYRSVPGQEHTVMYLYVRSTKMVTIIINCYNRCSVHHKVTQTKLVNNETSTSISSQCNLHYITTCRLEWEEEMYPTKATLLLPAMSGTLKHVTVSR